MESFIELMVAATISHHLHLYSLHAPRMEVPLHEANKPCCTGFQSSKKKSSKCFHDFLTNYMFFFVQPSFYKSPNQETGLLNRGRLKVLNDIKIDPK